MINESQVTVFIVDDDIAVRKSLQRLLLAHQYLVETYASAEDFLTRVVYTGIGTIILDLSMPGLDGMSLQKRLLDQGSQLPVIFLTANGDIHTSVTAMKRGAENFLTKPIDEIELITTISAAISHHSYIYHQELGKQSVQQKLQTLTPREFEVLRYMINGTINKKIAAQLSIAEKTVKVHRARVLEKMQVSTLVELVRDCDFIDLQPLVITNTSSKLHKALEN
jgi:FixJ family two-component response regulator